ncbi:MAG: cupin domain-containing protein [Micropepsaceae bacterium]
MTIKLANPVSAANLSWVPLRQGISFKPLHFAADGYSLQLRVEPGNTIPLHRHTGEVNAYNLSGHREIVTTGEQVGPGDFVYEPAGNVDSWRCVGDEPCIVQISLKGRVEYLDERGHVTSYTDAATARAAYFDWCHANAATPCPSLAGE